MYHGFARSAGLDYWESARLHVRRQRVLGDRRRATPPSRNDQIATGIGGTFFGEVLFRMANLRARAGRRMPPSWREVAAAAISPATGFNRLVFGDRFGDIFDSHDAAYYSRLGSASATAAQNDAASRRRASSRNEALARFRARLRPARASGLRRTRGRSTISRSRRRPRARTAFENVMTRGLLIGKDYEAGPTIPRRLGPLRQLRLHRAADFPRLEHRAVARHDRAVVADAQPRRSQGTAMLGAGYTAVGTRARHADEATTTTASRRRRCSRCV